MPFQRIAASRNQIAAQAVLRRHEYSMTVDLPRCEQPQCYEEDRRLCALTHCRNPAQLLAGWYTSGYCSYEEAQFFNELMGLGMVI